MSSELTQIEQNDSVVVLNPSEIFGLYSDFLARQGGKVVGVRGIFNSGAGKSYCGFYYDTISDQYSGQELGIKIPSILRDRLSDGNLVDLAGVIERKLNPKGYIQLTLAVTRADIVLEQTMSEDDMKRIEIRNRKTERGFKNVDWILESRLMADERPQVALVFAETSITDADFNAGKEAAETKIDFEEFRSLKGVLGHFVDKFGRNLDAYADSAAMLNDNLEKQHLVLTEINKLSLTETATKIAETFKTLKESAESLEIFKTYQNQRNTTIKGMNGAVTSMDSLISQFDEFKAGLTAVSLCIGHVNAVTLTDYLYFS